MKKLVWLIAAIARVALIFSIVICNELIETEKGKLVNAAEPVIDIHPQSSVYLQNDTPAPLQVTASVRDGGTLSYLWFRTNKADAPAETSVGTEATYTPSTETPGISYYYVVITNTNNSATGNKTAKTVSSYAQIAVNTSDSQETQITANSTPAQETRAPQYVTAVNVWTFPTEPDPAIPSDYTNWVKDDLYDPDHGVILNGNSGDDGVGDWVRFAYKTETEANKHEAIAEIAILEGQGTPTPAGWVKIDVDLNKGHPNASYLYLIYRKVRPSDTMAIDFIGSYNGKIEADAETRPDYSWVTYMGNASTRLNERADLNKGRPTANWIFLMVHKRPFSW